MNLVRKNMPRVGIVGLGYVGLPAALLTARAGLPVLGVDIRVEHVEALSSGLSNIEEPGLQDLLRVLVACGGIEFSTGVSPCDIYVIAVPTPVCSEKKADLSFVQSAAESIVPHLKRGDLVIVESTVSPGSCRKVVLPVLERSGLVCGKDIHLAYCPERVLPGNALEEIVNNDRVVGGLTSVCSTLAKDYYTAFVRGTIHVAGLEEAELTKLTENAFRDVNIAFANEIANLCDHLGVCHESVIRMANAHPRVNILKPGPGVGGHCIAVDPWFLVEAFPGSKLLRSAREVNDDRPKRVVDQVATYCSEKGLSKILVLGLTYKANVADLRESPALEIASRLVEIGFDVRAWEPNLSAPASLNGVIAFTGWTDSEYLNADAVIMLVDHKEFHEVDWTALNNRSRKELIMDTRSVLPQAIRTEVPAGYGPGVSDLSLPEMAKVSAPLS